MMARYAGAKHVPMPDIAVKASGAMLIIGGASILLGLKPKYGAAAVIAFLASVSPAMHRFWEDEDPGERQRDIIDFAKNLALAGGALALAGIEEPSPARVAKPGGASRAKTAWRVMAA